MTECLRCWGSCRSPLTYVWDNTSMSHTITDSTWHFKQLSLHLDLQTLIKIYFLEIISSMKLLIWKTFKLSTHYIHETLSEGGKGRVVFALFTFCQFSRWPKVKTRQRKACKKFPVDKYTNQNQPSALVVLQLDSI